jgi:hypothetical protein
MELVVVNQAPQGRDRDRPYKSGSQPHRINPDFDQGHAPYNPVDLGAQVVANVPMQ